MFNLIGQLRALVAQANAIAASDPGTDTPRWSLFLTNKSFVAAAVAVLIQIVSLAALIAPMPGGAALMAWVHAVDPGATAAAIADAVSTLLLVYSLAQRLVGQTRVIWSRRQALKAIEEARALSPAAPDPLTDALKAAMKNPA